MANYDELFRAAAEGRDPRDVGVNFYEDGAPSSQHVRSYAGVEDPHIEQDREDVPLWTHLKWLDSMGNAARNALGRTLVGDWDLLENASQGFVHKEHTTGKEIINQAMRNWAPETWERWRLKRLAENPAERIQQMATGEDDTNAMGALGSVLGFGLEVVTDPLTYIAPFMAPIARAQSAKRAVRMVRQQKASANIANDIVARADMVKRMTGSKEALTMSDEALSKAGLEFSSVQDEFANAGIPIPDTIGRVTGEAAGKAAAETAERVDAFVTARQADEGLGFLAGGSRVKYKGQTPVGVERADVKITRDSMGRVVRDSDTGLPFTVEDAASKEFIDDIVKRTRDSDPAVRSGAMAQYKQLREAGLRKAYWDDVLGDFTAQDVLEWMIIRGVHTGDDKLAKELMQEVANDVTSAVGPIRAAMEASEHAERGMANAMDGWRRYAEQTYEVAELAEPGLGLDVVPFGQLEREAALEMTRMQQWLRAEGQSVTGRGYKVGPIADDRYSMWRDHIRAAGVSEKHVDKFTVAVMDARKHADDLEAAMKDIRIADDIEMTAVTPEMLEVMSAEQTAITAAAAKLIHTMDRKLRINRLGASSRATGPVRVGDDVFGKNFLTKEQADDLLARRNALKKSLDEYVMDSQSRMGTFMEKVLGGEKQSWLADMLDGKLGRVPDDIASQVGPVRNLAMNAANLAARIGGQAVQATPGANALASRVAAGIRAPNPFLGDSEILMGMRDVARVFRGTGIYEGLRDASRSVAEARRHYQAQWNNAVKPLEKGDMYALGRALDGQDLSDLSATQRGRVEAALPAARAVFDELADLAGLPREARIADYFPHIFDEADPRAGEAIRKGFLAPEMLRSADVLGHMLHKQSVGKPFESKFFKSRTVDQSGKIDLNAHDVFGVYANSVLKAHYMAPAFRKARVVLTGDELAKPAERAARVLDGEAPKGQVVLKDRSEQMLGYLDDLERVNNGLPIRATARLWNQIDTFAERMGWERLRDPYSKASRLSQLLTMQIYRSALGFNLPTFAVNLTQNVVTAGEWGAMNVLKPLGKIVANEDPATMLHVLARGDDPAMKGFWQEAFGAQDYDKVQTIINERLGLHYHDLVEREQIRLSEKSSRIDHAFAMWDKWAFAGMDVTERINRGVAYNVGVTQALREGLDPISAMKVGLAVSDETQFFYGPMGRGPMFNTAMGRPFLGQFTSYPFKMIGVGNRMLTENPSALINYVTLSGAMAAIVSRAGLDPEQIAPFAGLPDRYRLLTGMTPIADMLTAPVMMMLESSKPNPDPEKIRRHKQDMVFSFPMASGLPINATRSLWHAGNAYKGEVRGTNDWVHEVDMIQDMFFAGDDPQILTHLEDKGTAYNVYVWSARLLGFHTEAEALAREAVNRLRKIEQESRKEKRYWVEIARDRGGFRNLTDEEYAAWRDAQAEFKWSDGEIRSMITRLEDFHETDLAGAHSRASQSSRRRLDQQAAGLASENPGLAQALMGFKNSER